MDRQVTCILPFFIALLLLYPGIAFPQRATPILDRKVSVSATEEKTSAVLNQIAQQASFSFSYNSAQITDDQVVTVSLREKTVREVLNEVFKGSITYKQKGNLLRLRRVKAKWSHSPYAKSVIISGYVENRSTTQRIMEASIYEKETASSVLTDESGFFRIKLDKKAEDVLSMTISKKGFKDTTLVIEETNNQYVHISLTALAKPPAKDQKPESTGFHSTPSDNTVSNTTLVSRVTTTPKVNNTVSSYPTETLELPYATSPNVQNISDTLYRNIQLSILPFIATNRGLSGNTVNSYSINILGGYSIGTEDIEVGGLFNIDRGHVGFVQLAGLGNMVGHNVNGLQAAGLFNIVGGKTYGIQLSGLTNVNLEEVDAVQIAGLVNINLAASNGVQIAGAYNQSNGHSDGVRLAGVGNVHKGDFNGPQVAGIFNLNRGMIRGLQVSGIFNCAHKVYGMQLGSINYADSLAGVPIGFLSIVKKGYHKIELSADETFYANLSFRTGVRKFYNIVLAGIKPGSYIYPDGMWTLGYGIGRAPKIRDWCFLNVDLTAQHVNNNAAWVERLSALLRLQVGFDFQLAEKFSIYVGGTLNGYLSEVGQEPVLFPSTTTSPPASIPGTLSVNTPAVFYDRNIDDELNMKMWLGGKIAFRFL